MKLLVIEDDPHILSILKRGFAEDGHTVDGAIDGSDGEYLASVNTYDVIILDWMLPSKSGIEIAQYLRAQGVCTPILMLSARAETSDKISGLRVGADDYLSKPFSFEELLVRVEALHRRSLSKGINLIELGDLSIDINSKSVSLNETKIELTAKEYELLMLLIKHKNSIVSKAMVEDHLWSNEEYINSNVVQVTMYHLRKKIGKGIIKSYRNLGYKIDDQ